MSEENSECCNAKIDFGYGFRRAFGFSGMGVYEHCESCGALIDWKDDYQTNSQDEIKRNQQHLNNVKGLTYDEFLKPLNLNKK